MKRKTSLYTTDMRHDIDELEGGGGGTGAGSDIITDGTETVIGTWDGKKFYRKFVELDLVSSSGNTPYPHHIDNVDFIKINTNLSFITNESTNLIAPLPYLPLHSFNSAITVTSVNNGNVVISTTTSREGFKIMACLEYTKE